MAFFLDPIVSKLKDKLLGLANEELYLILCVRKEIEKLCNMLGWIQAVLNDAQLEQITQEAVRLWLSNLNDVMYDADDILDECASREHPPEEPSIGCMLPLFGCLPLFDCFRQVKFTHEIGSKIRDLNRRLEQIWKMKSNLNLIHTTSTSTSTRGHRPTSSGVKPDIVGEAIEKNTIDLVNNWLTREDEGAKSHVVVLAIVGPDGIGKTTLAQKIFNDGKIKAAFKKTMCMWVWVSKEVVETDLLKEIIISAGGSPGEAQSKELLERKVKMR